MSFISHKYDFIRNV